MKSAILVCNAMIQAAAALIDAGTPPGLLKFFTGSAPADPTNGDTGTLLGTMTFSNPSFGSASGGIVTANAIANVLAVANGTVGYFRAYSADGTCRTQGTVGLSGADINFNNVAWVIGGTIAVSSLTWQQPQS